MSRGLSILGALLLLFSIAPGLVSGQDTNWSEMMPSMSPFARAGHDTAYDSESDRVILFGGNLAPPGSNFLSDETWGYDTNADAWQNLEPITGPSSRFVHAMAYDVGSDRIILYGGILAEGPETWAYDLNSNAWTDMSPVVLPTAWGFVDMTYDLGSDRIILFGGTSANTRTPTQADQVDETWAYDFDANTWTMMNPARAPSHRGAHGMAYDAESDMVVLFGGRDLPGDFGDTWAYDFDSDSWTEMSPALAPSPRHGHAMAYDERSDRIVLFGGLSLRGLPVGDETWVYDLNSNSWTQAEGVGPSPRFAASLAYDSESDRVVLFGGTTGGDETWVTPLVSATPPPDLFLILLAVSVAVGAGLVIAAFWVRRARSRRGEGKEGE